MISRDKINNEEELLKAAISLQTALFKDLFSKYSKAFDPNYKVGLFQNQEFFENKKIPIAMTLLKLAVVRLNTLPDVIYFIKKCQKCIARNKEADSRGGDLGKLLKKYANEFTELKIAATSLLLDLKNRANLQIEVFYHGLAMFQEMEDAYFYNLFDQKRLQITEHMTNVPSFHLIKLDDIKKNLAPSDPLISEIDNFKSNVTEPKPEKRNELKQILKTKIRQYQKQRISADVVNLMNETSFLELNPIDQVNLLVRRELIFNFVDALKAREKEFLWRLHMLAINSGLNTEIKNKRATGMYTGANIVKITKGLYLGGEGLLENQDLSNTLLTLTTDQNLFNDNLETLSSSIKNIIEQHLTTLTSLKELRNAYYGGWHVLWCFEDTDWEKVLKDFAENTILKDLDILEKLYNDYKVKNKVKIGEILEQDKSYLSRLPLEIRNQIYNSLLPKDAYVLRTTAKPFYYDKLLAEITHPYRYLLFNYTLNIINHLSKLDLIVNNKIQPMKDDQDAIVLKTGRRP